MCEIGPNCVSDNPSRSRFELAEQGLTAFADYRRYGDHVTIPYVESPVALRGKGTADRLMRGMAQILRDRGERVRPICPYAVLWFRRHPEFSDILV